MPSTFPLCCAAPTTKYFHNKLTGKCDPYTISSCEPLLHERFDTQWACEYHCIYKPKTVCELPPHPPPNEQSVFPFLGPIIHTGNSNCRDPVAVKYVPNTYNGKCDPFNDRDCDGLSNLRLNTQEDCEDYCILRKFI